MKSETLNSNLGTYGVPQPFYFFLTLRYWLGDDYILQNISEDIPTPPVELSGNFKKIMS